MIRYTHFIPPPCGEGPPDLAPPKRSLGFAKARGRGWGSGSTDRTLSTMRGQFTPIRLPRLKAGVATFPARGKDKRPANPQVACTGMALPGVNAVVTGNGI